MASALRTEKLDTGYDRHIVVAGVGIDIHRGEIVTLIGPNGAGKSTVLKTVAGQLAPLGGTVYINEQDASSYPAAEVSKFRAAMLTERMTSEQMTCSDVVSLGRYPYTGKLGILSDEDKLIVKESMDLVHVSELVDRDYHAISDGQRQRVLLARAICQEPQLMILDEPTSYLDIRHKLEFLDLLKSLVTGRNIGVIMSLHELELAHMISDRVICIDAEGSVVMTGTPDEVFTDASISSLYEIDTGRVTDLYSSFLKSVSK